MKIESFLENLYEKNYKKLLFTSLGLLLISLIILGVNYVSTGSVIDKDISLKGGTSITINKEGLNQAEISSFLSEKYSDVNVRTLADFSSRKNIGLIVESSDVDESELKASLKEKIDFEEAQYSAEIYSSSFSDSFFKQLIYVLIFSFILVAIVVSITFRTFIPSLAVILAAVTDILLTVAILSLFDFKISSGGITALLLIIGYSIDTDILLTTKLIKRNIGTMYERLWQSMKTGLTMTSATIVAVSIALMFSTAPVLKEIFLIILVALFIDIITTYVGNASMLIWHIKNKK